MKKLLSLSMMLLTVISTAACDGSDNESPAPDRPVDPAPGDSERVLVLYCSRTSNTERVAQQIHTTLGCDMVEVVPATPYDEEYGAMLERAQEELAAIRQGDYPAIRTSVDSFDDYDVVFVGYPIWYGSMATPMQTFLHENASKLAGKRIALFATSGSSGISSSVAEARALCPAATFTETLLLTSSTLAQTESRVTAWLKAIGMAPEQPGTPSLKMRFTTGGRTVTATMEDNAAARDFLSRLPLTVTLEDYNHTAEKIFYPRPELTTEGVAHGCTPSAGDITVYLPWGNVAIFCRSGSQSNDLIRIGRIDDDGIEALTVPGNLEVKFERI